MRPRGEIAPTFPLRGRIRSGWLGLFCGTAAVLAVFGWRFLPPSVERSLGYLIVLLSSIWAIVSFLSYRTFRSYQVGFGISLALFTVALLLYQAPGNRFFLQLSSQTVILYPLTLLILQNIFGPPEREGRFSFPRWLLRFDPVLRRAETNPVFEAFGRVRLSRKRWKYSRQVVGFVCLLVGLNLLVPLIDSPFAGPANMTRLLVVLVAAWIGWRIFWRTQSTRSHPPNRMPHALTDLLNPKKGIWAHQALDLWMTGCGGREIAEALYLEHRLRNFQNPWAWGVWGLTLGFVCGMPQIDRFPLVVVGLALSTGIVLFFIGLYEGMRRPRKAIASLRAKWIGLKDANFSPPKLRQPRYDVFLGISLIFMTCSLEAAAMLPEHLSQDFFVTGEVRFLLITITLTAFIGIALGVGSLRNFRRLWPMSARENLYRFRRFQGTYREIMEVVERRTKST